MASKDEVGNILVTIVNYFGSYMYEYYSPKYMHIKYNFFWKRFYVFLTHDKGFRFIVVVL